MPFDTLLEAHSAARQDVLDQVREILTVEWARLGSWDEADVAGFVRDAAPLVNGGQDLTGLLVDSYISEILSEATQQDIPPQGVPNLSNLRGAPDEEVYRRPFVTLWTALKSGEQFDDALAAGLDRLTRLAEDDLSLAYREATNISLTQNGVTTYRRVIRPELSGNLCGLCVAAAGQVYRTGKLMPIHTHCRCAVMPVLGSVDPGRDINGTDIDSLYRQASKDGRTAKELSKARFAVQEHGELGPMLMPAGQKFTGPSDI